MTTVLRRLLAGLAAALLAGVGLAFATSWSPTTVGLVSAVSADDDGDDDDGGDDDGGQVPAGSVQTGQGGLAGDDDDGGDDDGGDDDGGQVPAGGVQTGQGGLAGDDDDGDDDDGGDDDGGQVPAGGVQTGFGGTAESWTGESVSNQRSGGGDVASTLVPVAALGLGGLVVGRVVMSRLGRS